MADIFNIGLTALLAHKRALASVSNNIANVNTAGYSRQRVELVERPPEAIGRTFVGTGVDVGLFRRFSDNILAAQVNDAAASFGRAETFTSLAASLDNLLADSQTGLSAGLQDFFNAVQDLSDDPASTAGRQVLLTSSESLTARLNGFDDRLTALERETSGRVSAAITDINGIATGIAQINREIVSSGSSVSGQLPPDLLDERDLLVSRLAELVRVETVQQSNGTLNVFIGSGQGLVLGTEANQLAMQPGDLNPLRFDVVLQNQTGPAIRVADLLRGGELGGALDFRREMLEPVRNELGRIAYALAEQFNAVHRDGMDLNDSLGGDFFSVAAPQAFASQGNTGTGAVAVTITDITNLAASSYQLSFDGATYTLVSETTGTAVAMSGSGTAGDPFVAEGLSIVVSGAPAAGDLFRLEPLSGAAGSLALAISDPRAIAAAVPVRTRAEVTNTGNAFISPGEVINVANGGLLATTTIVFDNPPTSFTLNGVVSFPYVPGGDININGARVQIDGSPNAGDTFVLEANFGGVGDNRNALRLAGVGGEPLLLGGTTSLLEGASLVVGQVGAQTLQSTSQRDVQGALLNQARADLASVVGVNLDEEAADLLRYEQAYQAAAQTIAIADTLFQSLLASLRR